MSSKSFGFIGGGRVTKILLKGFQNAGVAIDKAVISDTNSVTLQKLKSEFPVICISQNDNKLPAQQDIVFISLHPPVLIEQLKEIKDVLNPNAILISLAPKITINQISDALDGFNRIVRMNPNAPSIINKGFNPVCFSESISQSEKEDLLNLLSNWGKTPEVEEQKIEAFAVITAMGPTYFWYQLYELKYLAESFGLTEEEIKSGFTSMMDGAIDTMFRSGLNPEEVMDLVPVKPLGEEEDKMKEAYKERLQNIFNKIKTTI